jgi:hypothetical protein
MKGFYASEIIKGHLGEITKEKIMAPTAIIVADTPDIALEKLAKSTGGKVVTPEKESIPANKTAIPYKKLVKCFGNTLLIIEECKLVI